MQALVDAQNLDRRIQEVGRLYSSLTGGEIRPRPGHDTELPPEKDPYAFVSERLDQLVRALTPVMGGPSTTTPAWMPCLDVMATDAAIVVLVDLPGVAREDVSVTVADNLLVIQGERRRPEALRTLGRPFGKFARTVPLPSDASVDRLDATLADGVLTVRFDRNVRPTRLQDVEIR